jgi:transposase-like protein
MRTKVETDSEEAEKRVRDIRRATRRQYSAEEKIRIVIAGLRGEDSIAELCRKEGINQNLYYRFCSTNRIISSFSAAAYLMYRTPHCRVRFF